MFSTSTVHSSVSHSPGQSELNLPQIPRRADWLQDRVRALSRCGQPGPLGSELAEGPDGACAILARPPSAVSLPAGRAGKPRKGGQRSGRGRMDGQLQRKWQPDGALQGKKQSEETASLTWIAFPASPERRWKGAAGKGKWVFSSEGSLPPWPPRGWESSATVSLLFSVSPSPRVSVSWPLRDCLCVSVSLSPSSFLSHTPIKKGKKDTGIYL